MTLFQTVLAAKVIWNAAISVEGLRIDDILKFGSDQSLDEYLSPFTREGSQAKYSPKYSQ
jgi:hypothetical protein